MQGLLPPPFEWLADPAGKELLALALEADHETEIRAVDGRRDGLELGNLGGVPEAALPIAVFDRVSQSLARERFLTTLLLLFASVGLALAVVGVYGVMAQMARRRVREMGIRLALGAQANDVRWLVVRNGLRLVAVGLVVGTAGALLATRLMQALLYGVASKDPLTFVAVPVVLVATAVVATWVPATFASRADPATALRAE